MLFRSYPPMSDQLRALGIDLIEGFGADQMALKPDMFVVGNVVSRARLPDGSPKFPLMEAILEAAAPYTSGPQWLADHLLHATDQPRHVLAVAGTHGKTTTTSMLAWILEHAGLQPGFLVGGVPLNFGVSARLGQHSPRCERPLFVIEADEYDTAFFDKRSKFVHYRPRTAILNNLEFDHADIFDNLAAIERQFHHLVRTVPASGRVVVNAGPDSLQRVLKQGCWSEVAPFGVAVQGSDSALDAAGWQLQGPPDRFQVLHNGLVVAEVQWSISGVHNQLNALAAIAAAQHVGVSPADAAQALSLFQNVRRRMEVRGTIQRADGVITVYDDFAHHPTAMATTIDGLRRQVAPGERIGFLGPNGAGKTTTLKLLMQLIFPTAGRAEILGRPVGDPVVRQRIGYLPENPYFYDYLTAEELLQYFASLFGLSPAEGRRRAEPAAAGRGGAAMATARACCTALNWCKRWLTQ